VLLEATGCQKSMHDAPLSQVTTATISLPSMVCELCAKTITKAVNSVEGVQGIVVNVDDKSARVQYLSSKTSLDAIENAIVLAGYDANGKKRSPEAYEKLDKCCKIDD